MGAFQNKAVQLVRALDGEETASEQSLARERLLLSMLDLYYATGGTLEELTLFGRSKLARGVREARVDMAMGDLLQALAVLGHINDIDIIQAGYNTLDAQLRALKQRCGDQV